MKIGIFFCDIEGTLTDGDNKDFMNFIENLETIKEVDELDQLYFSLISSNELIDVIQFFGKIRPMINNSNIKIGPLFSNKKQVKNNHIYLCNEFKVTQLLDMVKTNKYNSFYFADDSYLYHKMVNTIIDNSGEAFFKHFILGTDDTEISDYVSTSTGIKALNEVLEQYCKDIKNSKNKNQK